MIPRRFTYHRPASALEAVELVAADPDGTRVLGGGTWLVPDLNSGAVKASAVVDLTSAGLTGIDRSNGTVRIGAMVTYDGLLRSAAIQRHLPLLGIMAAGVTGGRQITTQGTVGGSAVAARPGSDLPAAITAARGDAIVAGSGYERSVPAGEFFRGAMESALAPGEILVGWDVPSSHGVGHGYVKLKHNGSSWPIITAGAVVGVDADHRCTSITLVLGGLESRPTRVDLTTRLVGERISDALIAEATAGISDSIDSPWADVLAPADYRQAVTPPIATRALRMAIENAGATGAGGA